MVLDTGSLVLGVDFTSAPSARKPITVARGRWFPGGVRNLLRLEEVEELRSLDAFSAAVATAGPWLGGFDLPFGQPRSLIEHEGWPTTWPAFVRFYCGQPRPALRETFRRWCDRRPPGDKFAWRKADKPAGSSPAMRWTNPPVAWMMHAGIERLLDAGLVFPAHRHGSVPDRIAAGADAGGSARVALEAYPGFTVRHVCSRPYKSDAAGSRTPERTANRGLILEHLVAGTAGLDVSLEITTFWSGRLIDDPGGDLLDAVICGLQAAHAATLPDFGLPPDLDPLEGWIASVPWAAATRGRLEFPDAVG